MSKDLTEIFEKLSSDHQTMLLKIAKDMKEIEDHNRKLAELTGIKIG